MKFSYLSLYTFIFWSFALSSCAQSEFPLASAYQQALVDASVVQANEQYNALNPLNADNSNLIWNQDHSKVLVVTWKSRESYEQFIAPNQQTSASEDYVLWVTLAPQVANFCREYAVRQPPKQRAVRTDLRLKQYLGLDSTWSYDVFVELWVAPEDIFRPCVDPGTEDTGCELNFDDHSPQVKNIADYQDFYKNLYYKSFRAGNGAPWTGLGYTYDWGNLQSEVGASEYILSPSSNYRIHQAVPTQEYCSQR